MLDRMLLYLVPRFSCLGRASEHAGWQPSQGVVMEQEAMRQAGMTKLASKHERVAFGVKRAA